MSEALKQCPFCGSNEVEIKHIVSVKGDVNDYFGSCKKCRTNMRCFKTEEEAIKAWNRRPSPWHTKTPTEEGWYLYEWGVTGGSYATYRADTKKELAYLRKAKRWQKIEPYKES